MSARATSAALLVLAACGEPVTVEWTRQLGAPSYSTPAVTGDLVIFGTEAGDVLALERAGGKVRWTFSAQRAVVAGPVVAAGKVFVGSTNSLFYAIDLATGREAWKFPARDRIKGDATVDGARVYFGSYDGHVYALGFGGSLQWVFPSTDGASLGLRDFSYSSPRVARGTLYIGNHDGNLYALDADSGRMRWRFATGGAITSTPAVEGTRVVFGSNDGKVRLLEDAGSEPRLVWERATGGAVNAAPRLHEGVVYVGSTDGLFYALDLATGAPRWKYLTTEPVMAGAAPCQGLVFTAGGAHDGRILALGPGGELAWSLKTGFKIDSDPIALDDRVYVTGGDGRVYALKVKRR